MIEPVPESTFNATHRQSCHGRKKSKLKTMPSHLKNICWERYINAVILILTLMALGSKTCTPTQNTHTCLHVYQCFCTSVHLLIYSKDVRDQKVQPKMAFSPTHSKSSRENHFEPVKVPQHCVFPSVCRKSGKSCFLELLNSMVSRSVVVRGDTSS